MSKSKKKRRNPDDKIFDNSYKQGTINHDIFTKDIQVNKYYEIKFLENQKNSFDNYLDIKLAEIIHEIWNNLCWSNIFKNKRHIPKNKLLDIYHDIKINFKEDLYSNDVIFCAIAEFLSIQYSALYEMISTNYKQEILIELKKKYPHFFKNQNFNLF